MNSVIVIMLVLVSVLFLQIGSVVAVDSAAPLPFGNPTRMLNEPAVPPFSSNENGLSIGTQIQFFEKKLFLPDSGKRRVWLIMVPLVVGLLILVVLFMPLIRVVEQPKRNARVFYLEP